MARAFAWGFVALKEHGEATLAACAVKPVGIHSFNRRRFDDEVIIFCVPWYLRSKLNYRDVSEICGSRKLKRKCCEIKTKNGKKPWSTNGQAVIATWNRSDMNAACPRMSLFANQRICPLRIMFTVSIPCIVRQAE
jgi:hypothetical protein